MMNDIQYLNKPVKRLETEQDLINVPHGRIIVGKDFGGFYLKFRVDAFVRLTDGTVFSATLLANEGDYELLPPGTELKITVQA
jgi:hypothetical protein